MIATTTLRGAKFGSSQSRIHRTSQIPISRNSSERIKIRGEDMAENEEQTKKEALLKVHQPSFLWIFDRALLRAAIYTAILSTP